MNIEVNGNNNRVAGRDYIENPIKACPSCENSVIDRDKLKCNRCVEGEQEAQVKACLLVFGLCLLFVLAKVSDWRAERGYPTGLEGWPDNFAIAFGITLTLFGAVWALFTIGLPVAAQWLSDRFK